MRWLSRRSPLAAIPGLYAAAADHWHLTTPEVTLASSLAGGCAVLGAAILQSRRRSLYGDGVARATSDSLASYAAQRLEELEAENVDLHAQIQLLMSRLAAVGSERDRLKVQNETLRTRRARGRPDPDPRQ